MSTGQRSDEARGSDGEGPFGPPSPLEPASLALGWQRPVTRGFVVGLVALNLLALGWMDHRQQVRMDDVAQSASNAATSIMGFPPAGSDPATCWLLGVVANGQGKGDVVARMDASSGITSDCQMYAARGARGQDLDGN